MAVWEYNADDADYSAGESTKRALKLRPLFVVYNFVFFVEKENKRKKAITKAIALSSTYTREETL